MTRVMDGLRDDGHTLAVRLGASTQPLNQPQPKRLHASTLRSNAGVRYATGIDGMRRPVTEPALATAEPRRVRRRSRRKVRGNGRPVLATSLVVVTIALALSATALLKEQNFLASNRPAVQAAIAATAAPTPTATPTPTPPPIDAQPLLNAFAAKYPGKFSIVVKDLTTGQTASINADKQLTSASLYKLFVAARIYARIEAGTLSYTTAAGGGTGRTIEGCLKVMINISDNACGAALGTLRGWGKQNAALKADGYTATSLTSVQKTSAADVALLLERVYEGKLTSTDTDARFMALLKSQRVNNRLPVGLPKGTLIAHKTGDLNGYMHDAGIVYASKTNYLVTVMGAPGVTAAQFASLSRQLWQLFEQ
jgi:beta-lactamase class A